MNVTTALSLGRSCSEFSSFSLYLRVKLSKGADSQLPNQMCARSQSHCFLGDFCRTQFFHPGLVQTCASVNSKCLSHWCGPTLSKDKKYLNLENCCINRFKAPNTGLGLKQHFGFGFTIFLVMFHWLFQKICNSVISSY